MKLKILIVEDEEPVGDLLETAITGRLKALAHEPLIQRCRNIPHSKSALEDFRPHVVTLDLKDDSTDDMSAGKPAWEFIRNTHFCPVVFFSANPLPEGFPDGTDPFAQYLNKNEQKADDVAATVENFIPHIIGLEGIRSEVESRYAKSLQKVSKLIWVTEKEPEARKQALLRVTRRQLAAALEHPLGKENSIKAWEQFIYPPIDTSLCTGDILHKVDGTENPGDFRVILSPPCDLVEGPNRHPVAEVLLGRCVSVRSPEVLRKKSLKEYYPNGQSNANLPEQLGKKLCDDKLDGMVVIPKLSGVFPAMVLDLKSLHVAEREKIAAGSELVKEDSEFIRLASMDSPFREALSWRFTHTIGRPGYPPVDEESLGRDLKEEASKI